MIIKKIENCMWANARQMWFTNKMQEKLLKNNVYNFYGEVEVFLMKFIYQFKLHSLIQNCSQNCMYNRNVIVSENSIIKNYEMAILK